MTTYTKRFALPEHATPYTEDERQIECKESQDERWEATVRWREDDLQIAERKLSETGQLLFHAKQRIKQLEEKLKDTGHE